VRLPAREKGAIIASITGSIPEANGDTACLARADLVQGI
jgi:hypothetical protein